jgi:hypothetical protein
MLFIIIVVIILLFINFTFFVAALLLGLQKGEAVASATVLDEERREGNVLKEKCPPKKGQVAVGVQNSLSQQMTELVSGIGRSE